MVKENEPLSEVSGQSDKSTSETDVGSVANTTETTAEAARTGRASWKSTILNIYRHHAFPVAVLATIFAGLTYWTEHDSLRYTQLQEFRFAIVDLAQSMPQPSNWQITPRVSEVYAGRGPLEATVSRVHYEAARRLEREVKDKISFAEYLILADAACAFEGLNQAEAFASTALERLDEQGASDNTRCLVYATLGRLYGNYYPMVPIEKSREYFHKATQGLSGLANGEKSHTIEADVWVTWALVELRAENIKAGESCLKHARNIIVMQSSSPRDAEVWTRDTRFRVERLLGNLRNDLASNEHYEVDDNMSIKPASYESVVPPTPLPASEDTKPLMPIPIVSPRK